MSKYPDIELIKRLYQRFLEFSVDDLSRDETVDLINHLREHRNDLQADNIALRRELADEKAKVERVIQCILDEPECEGDMPDEVWETIKTKDDATAYSQLLVRLTKQGILNRIQAIKEIGE